MNWTQSTAIEIMGKRQMISWPCGYVQFCLQTKVESIVGQPDNWWKAICGRDKFNAQTTISLALVNMPLWLRHACQQTHCHVSVTCVIILIKLWTINQRNTILIKTAIGRKRIYRVECSKPSTVLYSSPKCNFLTFSNARRSSKSKNETSRSISLPEGMMQWSIKYTELKR